MLIRTQNICFIVLMIISRLIVTRGENLRKVKDSVGMQKLEEKSLKIPITLTQRKSPK